MEDEYSKIFKITLVGDTGVGKTPFMTRYTTETLPKNNNPTIGVEFSTKVITLNDEKVKLQIWDTGNYYSNLLYDSLLAGQERYRALTKAHYKKVLGFMILYDVTKENTFKNVAKWLEEIKQADVPEAVIMLVGNKIDLVNSDSSKREVSEEEVKDFANKNNLLFEETSALLDLNVNEAFERLAQNIYEKNSVSKSEPHT